VPLNRKVTEGIQLQGGTILVQRCFVPAFSLHG
jgi:hypothetical protein